MRTKIIVAGKTIKEDDSFRLWSIHAHIIGWRSRGKTTGPLPYFGVLELDNIARVNTDPIINAGLF